MRIAGYALLGFLSGAIFGLIGAFMFVTLWYDVLRIGATGPEGYGGFGTLLGLAIVLPLIFGAAGAFWMGRRAHATPAGQLSCGLLAGVLLLPFLLLCCVLLLGLS